MPSADPTVGDVVLPGDRFLVTASSKGKVCLGPGLCLVSQIEGGGGGGDGGEGASNKRAVHCCKAGVLKFRSPNAFWVDSHQKRYIPAVGDYLIGHIASKIGVDFFRVDVGAAQPAVLSYLHFEGATKKNRPNVKVGDLVFCRVLVDDKHREPEVSCVDNFGKSAGMGLLDGGMIIQISLNCVRKITSKDCILVKSLGKHLPFEIACGMNGRIWVKAGSVKNTIAVCNAISNCEFMNEDQIKLMIRSFVDSTSEQTEQSDASTAPPPTTTATAPPT